MQYITAGESHGPALTAILKGLPAGFRIDPNKIQEQTKRRQSGFGRGGRMKIEGDQVDFLSGLRSGLTLGSPVTLQIINKDFENWLDTMHPLNENHSENITLPRPGHADYAGMIKYDQKDLRNILERASARETAIRNAVGAVCRQILEDLGIRLHSRVLQIGKAATEWNIPEEKDFEKKR
ncbi:MAG: chorismate synthase, partial [Candidatus Marinimicrobia bacterium]|nr:chorismate synthase [Candidatus Neomarinimicrobiota bacterium]